MTINQCARAFVLGTHGRCHNAQTDGTEYLLHGTRIAWRKPDNTLWASFANCHSPTTLNHLKAIARAAGAQPPRGYSSASRPATDPWQL